MAFRGGFVELREHFYRIAFQKFSIIYEYIVARSYNSSELKFFLIACYKVVYRD